MNDVPFLRGIALGCALSAALFFLLAAFGHLPGQTTGTRYTCPCPDTVAPIQPRSLESKPRN